MEITEITGADAGRHHGYPGWPAQDAARCWLAAAREAGVTEGLPDPDDDLSGWLHDGACAPWPVFSRPDPGARHDERTWYELHYQPARPDAGAWAVPLKAGTFATPGGGTGHRAVLPCDGGEAFWRLEILRRVLKHDAVILAADLPRVRFARHWDRALTAWGGFLGLADQREEDVSAEMDTRLPSPVLPEVRAGGATHETSTGNTIVTVMPGGSPYSGPGQDIARWSDSIITIIRYAPLDPGSHRDQAIATLTGYCGTIDRDRQVDPAVGYGAWLTLSRLADRDERRGLYLLPGEARELRAAYRPDEAAWAAEAAWAQAEEDRGAGQATSRRAVAIPSQAPAGEGLAEWERDLAGAGE